MSHRLKRDILLIIHGLQQLRPSGASFDWILRPRDCCDETAYTDAASSVDVGGFIEKASASLSSTVDSDQRQTSGGGTVARNESHRCIVRCFLRTIAQYLCEGLVHQ